MNKTFVGFGFGPIQSGLFLLEAWQSGNFGRLVVAEIDGALVKAMRGNGQGNETRRHEGAGSYTVNVAGPDGIRKVPVPNVELYNPDVPGDRQKLIDAIASADELATALPSVNFFDTGRPTDAAALLAEGFSRRPANHPAIVYAAENHNHAAEILEQKIRSRAGGVAPANVQCLNTVIGKMSGVITDAPTLARLDLAPLLPGMGRAVLVEQFNRILISRVTLAGFQRGINVFVEKDDLIPFEEAKLYGHNAIHALIGYLAALRGYETMAQAGPDSELMSIARGAFIDESGTALIRRWAKSNDPLFTAAGYREYARDLLARMVLPNLNDLVARVVRDPARKLGYDDRFFGTMRIALEYGITPKHLATGAAAAVIHWMRSIDRMPALRADPATTVAQELVALWGAAAEPQVSAALIPLVGQAAEKLIRSHGL